MLNRKHLLQMLPFFLFATFLITGCGSSGGVVPNTDGITISTTHKTILISDIVGGQDESFWTGPKVSNEDLRTALTGGLSKFLQITSSTGGLVLTAQILTQDSPSVGLNFSVSLTVQYTIKDKLGNKIFQESIYSTSDATVCTNWVAAARLKIANDGAVRENVRLFLLKLAETDGFKPSL